MVASACSVEHEPFQPKFHAPDDEIAQILRPPTGRPQRIRAAPSTDGKFAMAQGLL
jgi:hypothetical protein